ncbi:hypothetical protein FKM82_000055 [Ascaphus truei]
MACGFFLLIYNKRPGLHCKLICCPVKCSSRQITSELFMLDPTDKMKHSAPAFPCQRLQCRAKSPPRVCYQITWLSWKSNGKCYHL